MLSKIDVKDLIYRNREFFFKKEDYIKRDIDFKKKINSSMITIITGIRRCGKSVLLKLIKDYLLSKKLIIKENCYYLNFNDPFLSNINIKDIFEIFTTYFDEFPSKKKLIFIDEVQEIKDWHKLVLNFFDSGYKVIITGSNGNLLSKDIATYLTGRNNIINLFPFSFTEFLKLKRINYKNEISKLSSRASLKYTKLFKEYLQKGGFPLILKEDNIEILADYYENILNKDVIVRNSIHNSKELKELAFFLISNSAKIQSYNSLKKIINIKSTSTIKEYLDYLISAFIIFNVDKFDYSIKKQIYNSKKFYVIDSGFINYVSFSFSKNIGRLLENIVFLELKRNAQEVFYYSNSGECDFLIRKNHKIISAIQVCYDFNNQSKQREIQGLLIAMKTYSLKKGYILTYDKEDVLIINNKKIFLVPVWKWLLK